MSTEQQRRDVYCTQTWRNLRGFILERDGDQCVQCNRAWGLQVHHIKPIKEGGNAWDPENLQTLCAKCHRQEHAEPNPERDAWILLIDREVKKNACKSKRNQTK